MSHEQNITDHVNAIIALRTACETNKNSRGKVRCAWRASPEKVAAIVRHLHALCGPHTVSVNVVNAVGIPDTILRRFSNGQTTEGHPWPELVELLQQAGADIPMAPLDIETWSLDPETKDIIVTKRLRVGTKAHHAMLLEIATKRLRVGTKTHHAMLLEIVTKLNERNSEPWL